jgi:hypothetical protein
MKLFVAGATRAIGSQLVPQLTAASPDDRHDRSPAKTDDLWAWALGRSWPTRWIPTRSPVPWPRPRSS